VIKSPIQQSLMLKPGLPRDDFDQQALTNLFSEPGKIQPIASEPDGSIFKMPAGGPVPIRPVGPINPLLMSPTDAMQMKMRTGDFAPTSLGQSGSNAVIDKPDATMTEAARIAKDLQSAGGSRPPPWVPMVMVMEVATAVPNHMCFLLQLNRSSVKLSGSCVSRMTLR
jgi:hypothetical protein